MANGLGHNPRDLAITVSGTPGQVNTWRTAALPPSHRRDAGYSITPEDAERIKYFVAQQVDGLVAEVPKSDLSNKSKDYQDGYTAGYDAAQSGQPDTTTAPGQAHLPNVIGSDVTAPSDPNAPNAPTVFHPKPIDAIRKGPPETANDAWQGHSGPGFDQPIGDRPPQGGTVGGGRPITDLG